MLHLLFGLLVGAFFAVLALVVDVGAARIAQNRMAGATDAAALEGIRLEDSVDDAARRQAARDMVCAQFLEEFDCTADHMSRFGAGAGLDVVGAVYDMGALGVVVSTPSGRWAPVPQLNPENLPFGDMVRGWHDPQDPTSPTRVEGADYGRTDFATEPVAACSEAFLVRLRRTPGDNPHDEVAGVSSRGPPLPWIFGRASLMGPEARARGITVRSTSVAQGRSATTVGRDNTGLGLVGYPAFALEYDFWNAMPVGVDTAVRFGQGTTSSGGGATGIGAGGAQPDPSDPPVAGPPIVPPGQINGSSDEPRFGAFMDRSAFERKAWSVGDLIDPAEWWSDADALERLGHPELEGYTPRSWFVPVYEGDATLEYDGRPGNSNPPPAGDPVVNLPKDEMPPRVVGFGLVTVVGAVEELDGAGAPNGTFQLLLRKEASVVAPSNASAVETPGLAGLPGSVACALRDLQRQLSEPLRAAAVAR